MDLSLSLIALITSAAVVVVVAIVVLVIVNRLRREQAAFFTKFADSLEAKHREMLRDLGEGLNTLGDRLVTSGLGRSEQLRSVVEQQLRQTRDALVALQISNNQELAISRETMLTNLGEHRDTVSRKLEAMRGEILEKALGMLGEQGRHQSETLQDSVRSLAQQLTGSIEVLTRTADSRLEQIQGRVNERLEEGFRKTNETFANVMARLATIDEAQRKIDGLTTNVVSLQELLGDKRSRGAFGEIQLENLVRNILPPSSYEFQHTLGNGHRADCVLRLPEPTGIVAVDSKFPLENYHRMFDASVGDPDRRDARRMFSADVKKHVDDIADRYIVPGETSDGAVMFVPAEAVFAEIHAYHAEVVDHAMQRRVWIVSPTTMMAVLNTARAVIKDVETRRQVHVIKDELGKLGKDFGRFEERMRKLATHIRQAHEDVENVQTSSTKIVRRFRQIEQVELDASADLERLEHALAEPEGSDGDDALSDEGRPGD
ncbi:MAG: DNA recombination protein RmuC [Betaproteobacteria bacterium]|nr:DNA recombination protein RmuC [Betaproteobacteria bacterium]